MAHDYTYHKTVFEGRMKPFAFVDLECFDANVAAIHQRAGKMPICVASKSIRCVPLIQRIQAHSPQFHSIMAFCVREAVYLASHGLDNILVAYPVISEVESSGLCYTLQSGTTITLMVDAIEHIQHLEAIGKEANVTIPVCIDVDMSTDYPGIHFGVRRSCITAPEHALTVWQAIQQSPHVHLRGVMGYEAQIAGVQDRAPGKGLENAIIRFLKKRSIPELRARRAAVVKALQEAGATLDFVNGGGTGSIESTIEEEVVTEVTAGSGFYSPTLFDHYDQFKHQPAAGFALEIVRQPLNNTYTCHGGGYIASGPPAWDRVPKPTLPKGATLLKMEGAGEVQTPIEYDGPEKLSVGDPVFFRHSKAGELCERFKTLLLVSEGKVVDEVNTYRGDGQCFL